MVSVYYFAVSVIPSASYGMAIGRVLRAWLKILVPMMPSLLATLTIFCQACSKAVSAFITLWVSGRILIAR